MGFRVTVTERWTQKYTSWPSLPIQHSGKHYTDQVYSTAAIGKMAMGSPEEIWWAVEIK